MPQTTLSSYQFCEEIGAGNAGEVYRSVDPADGAPVAIKRLNSMAIDRQFLNRNLHSFSRSPRHPGIVHVTDYQFDQTPYYLAMDLVENAETLEDLSVPLPESKAWQLIDELIDSMAHLHKFGVGHANLHPGNVFYAGDENPKTRLTDFGPGLAGRIHHIDIAETAWFAPPEQLENPEEYGDGALERWDVYRFGVMAFWLINGDVPRGHSYARLRRKMAAASAGRPVKFDFASLAEDFREHPETFWKVPAENRANQLRREVIDRCLAIDPTERPQDMREVQRAFEGLDKKFALEEAELRVAIERRLQAGKLLFSRGLAACLAVGLLSVSFFLFSSLGRNGSLHARVGELSEVVQTQRGTIADAENRRAQSERELKDFRSAAGSIFSQMSHSSATGENLTARANPISRENLEESRVFFEKSLRDLGDSPPNPIERATCLHNLAHVERQLGNTAGALQRYREAAALYETLCQEESDDEIRLSERELQLADCRLRLAGLIETDPGVDMLEALESASKILNQIRKRHPEDPKLAMRTAAHDLKLGRQLHAHRKFDRAIEVLASAGENLAHLPGPVSETATFLDLLSHIQYQAALSLREVDRWAEAFDSQLAAMETIARAANGRAFTGEQRKRLGQSYTELGELFSEHADPDETRAHFNEAIRLLTPLCEDSQDDPEAAIFLTRSLTRLAQLEREAAHWTEGYRMSLTAIEKLEKVLEQHPDHFECQLTLSGFRAPHAEILKYNRDAALRCLDNGLKMVSDVQKRIDEDETLIAPVRKTWGIRIAGVYDQFENTCKALGETGKAQMCADRANRARQLLVQAGR